MCNEAFHPFMWIPHHQIRALRLSGPSKHTLELLEFRFNFPFNDSFSSPSLLSPTEEEPYVDEANKRLSKLFEHLDMKTSSRLIRLNFLSHTLTLDFPSSLFLSHVRLRDGKKGPSTHSTKSEMKTT